MERSFSLTRSRARSGHGPEGTECRAILVDLQPQMPPKKRLPAGKLGLPAGAGDEKHRHTQRPILALGFEWVGVGDRRALRDQLTSRWSEYVEQHEQILLGELEAMGSDATTLK
jgi:hypothetical protein